MNVGADAVVCLQDGLVGIADTLMDFIPLTFLPFELERHLTGGLLRSHRGMDGQQSKTRQTLDVTLNAIRVFDGLSQHLITSTDAYHHLAITMSTLDGLRTTVTSQLHQIVKRSLCAGQNNDVGLLDISDVVGIEKIDAGVAL